jgi:hypothetical protein
MVLPCAHPQNATKSPDPEACCWSCPRSGAVFPAIAAQPGVSVKELAEYLGHADPGLHATPRYAHLLPWSMTVPAVIGERFTRLMGSGG